MVPTQAAGQEVLEGGRSQQVSRYMRRMLHPATLRATLDAASSLTTDAAATFAVHRSSRSQSVQAKAHQGQVQQGPLGKGLPGDMRQVPVLADRRRCEEPPGLNNRLLPKSARPSGEIHMSQSG